MADSYNNFAKSLDECEEALEMLTKSLEIRTRVYGGDSHPQEIEEGEGEDAT